MLVSIRIEQHAAKLAEALVVEGIEFSYEHVVNHEFDMEDVADTDDESWVIACEELEFVLSGKLEYEVLA